MTIILVPDWTKVKPHRKNRQITRGAPFETLRGWPLKRMGRHGCQVLMFGEASGSSLPRDLDDLPLRALHLHRLAMRLPQVVVTGTYQEGSITAEVTRIGSGRNGWIDVIGSNGTTLQELNAWYDALVAGDKAAFKA